MSDPTLGSIASTVTSSDSAGLDKVVTAGSEAAGAAYSVESIEEFKRHKDNPTEIPTSNPRALEATAAALEVAPSIKGTGAAESAASKLEEKL